MSCILTAVILYLVKLHDVSSLHAPARAETPRPIAHIGSEIVIINLKIKNTGQICFFQLN